MDQQLAQISALAAGPPPASVAIFNRLPVVCQTEFHAGFKDAVPLARLGPATKAHVNRIPLAIALIHVAPATARSEHMEHSIEIASIVIGRARTSAAFGGKQSLDDLPFPIQQIATDQNCLLNAKTPWPA
ncbi:hypothetical protein A8A54_20485 [Brucella pseudogrignonensis]|nr:hypothetical protein A8A54_20485 [Brucella pseudogrignonensis]